MAKWPMSLTNFSMALRCSTEIKNSKGSKPVMQPSISLQFVYAINSSGQSYKASTIVIYASRVVPDLKIPHITTLES